MKYLHFVYLGCRVFSKTLLAVWLLVMSGFGVSIASADDVVVPNLLDIVEGNINNCIPLTGCLDSDRYQQVYENTEFAALAGPHFITELIFRPDGLVATPFTGQSFADAEINLSTTPLMFGPDGTTNIGPDNLFEEFALNIGTDDVINAYRGALTLSSSVTGPAGGPKDFDVVIPLQTPFLYDPASGRHLLFEWKNRSSESLASFLDAEDITGDSISRVISNVAPGTPGEPDSPFGSTAAFILPSLGLVTQFTFFRPDELVLKDVPTPTGPEVKVVNVPDFFEQQANVIAPGLTSAEFCVGRDPRETIKNGRVRFKQRFLNVSEMSNTGSCGDLSEIDLRIHPSVRGFPGIFPAGGGGAPGVWIVIADIEFTGTVAGPVEVATSADTLIDFLDITVTPSPPACDTDLAFREVTFGGIVAAPGVLENVEGTRMIAESVLCTSGRNLSRRTTHMYPLRIDGKFADERVNIQWQLNGISDTILEAGLCVDSVALPVIALMQSSVDSAQDAIAQRRYANAVADLVQGARDAKDNSNGFSGCPASANYTGNFIMRFLVGAFTVFDRFQHPIPTGAGGDWVVYDIPDEFGIFGDTPP